MMRENEKQTYPFHCQHKSQTPSTTSNKNKLIHLHTQCKDCRVNVGMSIIYPEQRLLLFFMLLDLQLFHKTREILVPCPESGVRHLSPSEDLARLLAINCLDN